MNWQQQEDKNKILEPKNLIVSIEAGSTSCWYKYTGKNGKAIGINTFGKSAPYKLIFEKFNLTSNSIVSLIQDHLRR